MMALKRRVVDAEVPKVQVLEKVMVMMLEQDFRLSIQVPHILDGSWE